MADQEPKDKILDASECSIEDLETDNSSTYKSLLKSTRKQCKKLEEQVVSLKNDLSAVKLSRSERSEDEKAADLSSGSSKARRPLGKRNRVLSEAKESLNKDDQPPAEAEPQLSLAEAEMVFLMTEYSRQLEMTEKEMNQLQLEHSVLEASYKETKEENVRLKAKVDSLSERVSLLQSNLLSSAKISEAQKLDEEDKTRIIMALETLKIEHEKTVEDFQRRNDELQLSLAMAKERLKESESQRAAVVDDLERTQTAVSAMRSKVHEARSRSKIDEEKVAAVSEEKLKLEAELNQLTEKMELEREAKRETDNRVNDLLRQVRKAEEVLIDTKEHLSRQSEEMDELLKQKGLLEEAVANLEAENLSLEDRLIKKRNKMELIKAELGDFHLEKENLKQLVYNVKKENSVLRERLKAVEKLQHHHHHPEKNEEEVLKKLWQEEVVSRSKLGLKVAEIETEKQNLVTGLQKEMMKRKSILRLKEIAEEETQKEKLQIVKLRKRLSKAKASLLLAQRRKSSFLFSVPSKESPPSQTTEPFEKKKKINKSQSAGEFLNSRLRRRDMEELAFPELNQKLVDMNTWLLEQAAARERSEKLRDANDVAVRMEFRKLNDNLKSELSRLHQENLKLELDKEAAYKEMEKLRKLYDEQRMLNLETAAELDAVKNRMIKIQKRQYQTAL